MITYLDGVEQIDPMSVESTNIRIDVKGYIDLERQKVFGIMWQMLKSDYPPEAKLQSLLEFDKVLGLSIEENREELRRPLPDEIKKLVAEREKARRDQDWGKADEIRKQIADQGFELRDFESGPVVVRKR